MIHQFAQIFALVFTHSAKYKCKYVLSEKHSINGIFSDVFALPINASLIRVISLSLVIFALPKVLISLIIISFNGIYFLFESGHIYSYSNYLYNTYYIVSCKIEI